MSKLGKSLLSALKEVKKKGTVSLSASPHIKINTQRAKSRKPTHPGEILLEDILPELNISQEELAKHLQISCRALSEILTQSRPLPPDIALRLAHFLKTTPESWLNMLQVLDTWELKQKCAEQNGN